MQIPEKKVKAYGNRSNDKKMKILITGGTGFIGHHMIEHFIKNTDWKIIVLDRLSYAGDMNRVVDSGVDLSRIRFVYHDIRATINKRIANEIGEVDYIVHAAAETHVENSLVEPEPFIYTNMVGTFNMLEYARKVKSLKKYIQVSTDEVYGPAPKGVNWQEWDRLSPSNPYAATKAGGDCLAMAYKKSYRLPVTITRTMNNFGERQHPEKFVPMIIKRILSGDEISVHGEKKKDTWLSGSRIWLHARNHADAILFLLKSETDEAIINVVGDTEVSNLDMVKLIGNIMNKEPKWKWMDFHSSRPGHDVRYSLDGNKLFQMGWVSPMKFEESMKKTIEWTIKNSRYLEW